MQDMSLLEAWLFRFWLLSALVGMCTIAAVIVVGISEGREWLADALHQWRNRHLPPELRSENADLSAHKTIAEIMRGIDIQPVNELTWAIGTEARKLYESRWGVPPRKALRQKTSGKGSHDFAVYPPEMVPEIAELIRRTVQRRTDKAAKREDEPDAEEAPPPRIAPAQAGQLA